MLIYEQVFEMLRKGGVVMPVIFAVGWLAWISIRDGLQSHNLAV